MTTDKRNHLGSLCYRALSVLIAWTFLVLLASRDTSATPHGRAEVSPTAGRITDLFILTVTFDDTPQGVSPVVEESADFEMQLLGPRSLTAILNGQVRTQQSFAYQLTPKRSGTLHTPRIYVEANGQKIAAPGVAVTVNDAPTTSENTAANAARSSLFMNQTATPDSVYIGQQIVNALFVYTRVRLHGVSVESSHADGFWQEPISRDKTSQKTIDGEDYTAFELTQALFPLKTGTIVIPRRKGTAKIAVAKQFNPFGSLDPFGNDIFQNFFQTTEIQDSPLSSNELSVQVSPLPPIPADIARYASGLTVVGNTRLTVEYPDTVINVGESKNISVTVTSEGNLNPLQSLKLTPPPGVKLYDGQVQTDRDTQGSRLVMKRTFTFTAVPLQGSAIRIAGPVLPYFDPDTGSYKLASTPDITFMVTGAPPLQRQQDKQPQNNAPTSSDLPASAPTLRPLPIGPPLTYAEESTWEKLTRVVSVQLALLVLAATIALIGVGVCAYLHRRAQAPIRNLSAQLAEISELGEFEGVVRQWIASRVPTASASAPLDELRALVRSRLPDKNASIALISILDDIELQRYGRSSGSALTELKKRFSSAISRL